ncbi:hypothetical protein N665_0504s0002 [Sinapis alba]|nr:hypothetical protein N665_0504s0002 [Sinapis alba]
MFYRNSYALFFHVFSRFGVSGAPVIVHRSLDLIMTTARLPHQGKAIATASDSDNGSSPRLLGPRAITFGGMVPRLTSEDLAELNENERSIVQFSLDLEEREASSQAAVDDATEEVVPSSQPEKLPPTTKDKAAAEKEISLHLADLLSKRWTGTDFEFDDEIDPEQERRLSINKNQRWENHFSTRSTFKSVRRLVLQTNPPAGFSFLIPADHQRPWTPHAGYACVYESWFTNCSLWWPLPEFLTTYCHRRRIALGQYTANRIRILVTLIVLAAELGITMSVCLFEELTTPSITAKTGFFLREDGPEVQRNHREAVENRLSKWSQGGTEYFLEEVEAIRTLSHQHCADISEAHIQAALKRISRATDFSPNGGSRMGKINLATLPSCADTIGTPVHEAGSPGSGRPAKRRRSETAEEEARRSSPTRSPLTEEPEQNAEDIGRLEGPDEEILMRSPAVPANTINVTEVPIEEHHRGAGVLIPPNSTQKEGNARVGATLAKQSVPPNDPSGSYRKYLVFSPLVGPSVANLVFLLVLTQFFGSANLMVRDYEAKLKAQDEKIASKTGALKKKRKEIAELAYKCGSYEEQIGALNAEKVKAAERAEALSKELEELKALTGGLETRCHNLEQENAEILLRFETATKRLRESREHEVRKERLRVESILKNQIAPAYDKMRQFVEEQPSIQSKLALYSQAKGIRESLEKIHSQGLLMEEIIQQARADEVKYQGELQGMEVVEASEIDLTPIGIDEHDSNMAVFSPQVIEDLRSG